MPRFDDIETQEIDIQGPGSFTFSTVSPDDVDACEITLVTILLDVSGSIIPFTDKLTTLIKAAIGACQKSPRSDNLMVRLVTFNSNLHEIHGFINLIDIDVDSYDNIVNPGGATSLYDAAYTSIAAELQLAREFTQRGDDVNGCVFIITDGDDNVSSMTPADVRRLTDKAVQSEDIESILSVLIAIKDPQLTGDDWANHMARRLETFQQEAGITQFIDMGEVTDQKIAKAADFVSQSVSAQSGKVGSGTPSQPVNMTF